MNGQGLNWQMQETRWGQRSNGCYLQKTKMLLKLLIKVVGFRICLFCATWYWLSFWGEHLLKEIDIGDKLS